MPQRLPVRADRVASFPSADEIATRAHEMFVAGGRRIVRLPVYWRLAEAELLEREVQRLFASLWDDR